MVVQPYQWNAVDYAQSSSIQQQWARELLSKLKLRGDEKLLDIGSGDGKVTAEIARCLSNGSVIGIDNSEEMIALARNKYPQNIFLNLSFQQNDARRLTFVNEFDVVFSNATLHWILDQRPVVQGIWKSLKQNGKILLQMGGRGNAADVLAVFDTFMDEIKWQGYFQDFTFPYGFYDAEEYHHWLQETGFQEIRVELIPKNAVHTNRDAFEAWIRTTWLQYTQRVPVEVRDEFIARIAERYLEHHPVDEHSRVSVPMMRLEVEAVKR